MEEEIKKLLFWFLFSSYLPVFLLTFRARGLIGCEIKFHIQRVPHCILLMNPATPKIRNTWKNVMMTSSSCFSGISYFWGSGVLQKYVVWVLVGFGIKFRIQLALPPEIWVKTQRDMSKIWIKQVVFFYHKYVNSTIMVDSFYWNYIGSWIPSYKIYCWRVFL